MLALFEWSGGRPSCKQLSVGMDEWTYECRVGDVYVAAGCYNMVKLYAIKVICSVYIHILTLVECSSFVVMLVIYCFGSLDQKQSLLMEIIVHEHTKRSQFTI